jgi:hypothetical protein
MMRLLAIAGAFVAAIVAAGAAGATNVLNLQTEYSAASIIQTPKGVQRGRVWRTPTALRHESAEEGRSHTVIARLDRKLAWLLIPEQKLAIELGLDNFGLPAELLTGQGVKQTPVAQETVAGRRTTKVRVERAGSQNGNGRFDGHVWTTAEGIIMKVVGAGENQGRTGSVDMSFSDVKIGRQDPGLFELPTGYRRLALVGVDFESLLAGIEQFKSLSAPKQNRSGAAPR